MSRVKLVALVGSATAIAAVLALIASSSVAAESGEKKYSIAASVDRPQLKGGEQATFILAITPKPGFVLKQETPFKAKLAATSTVSLVRDEFSNKDFDDPNAAVKSIKTSFTAANAGKQKISADLTFFICDDELCERLKDKAAVEFAVQ